MSERTNDDSRDQEFRRPILILGLTKRTGTNYLSRVLQIHEDCTGPQTLFEDFLVSRMANLSTYVGGVRGEWKQHWGVEGKTGQLSAALGSAIEKFLCADAAESGKRPVFKTPSVKGLDASRLFLQNTDIVILLRSGPAVVESGMQSFDWSFAHACRRWYEGARIVAQEWRKDEVLDRRPYAVVRFEELVAAPVDTLHKLLPEIGLETSKFDFDKVESIDVYGSSTHRGDKPNVHWEPVPKTPDFDPLNRARHWSNKQLARFDQLTKGISAELGYEWDS